MKEILYTILIIICAIVLISPDSHHIKYHIPTDVKFPPISKDVILVDPTKIPEPETCVVPKSMIRRFK